MKRKPKVLYDYQIFHTQLFGGISRYFVELIERLRLFDSQLAIRVSANQYICGDKRFKYLALPKRIFKIFSGQIRKINVADSLKQICKGDYDIFHPTYYSSYFLDALNGKPFVLTIHDMTHEIFPQYFSPNDMTSINKKVLAEKADRIIAISQSTKNDVIRILGIDESKIDVIYHGINKQQLALGRPANLPEKYILYVGERRGYKNFESTAKAFAEIKKTHPDLALVLTNRDLSHSEHELFNELGIADSVHVFSFVSDQVLRQLYRNAAVFVYPSLYEGFGIPILEAFAQDCPVALSDASCFPEVAGDAGEYFDPQSVESQVQAIARLLDDESHRNALIAKGRARLDLFTWHDTAIKTEETYERVLSKQ